MANEEFDNQPAIAYKTSHVYVMKSHITSECEMLEEAVAKAKKNRECRIEFMTLLMRGQENRGKGKLALIEKLVNDKWFDDISKMII